VKSGNSDISINDIFSISNPEDFKLHLGSMNNDGEHPLDLFVEDRGLWKNWNEYRGDKDSWTRDYIFTLIEFYPRTDCWLFGGAFKVVERRKDNYVLEDLKVYEKYTGRVLCEFFRHRGMRGRHFYLENYIDRIKIKQIFEHPYTGETFPGYDNINHDYLKLERIIRMNQPDWKTALEHIKGVYIITDNSNGKSYIGSTCGSDGIWTRWAYYTGVLHGWNDHLIKLINTKGKKYAKENFRFSILELHDMNTSDAFILSRENFWKEKLLTRHHGYNRN